VKPWVDLYCAHRDARKLGSEKWDKAFRMRLVKLAKAGYCEQNIQGRFTYER
jgi:nuclear transport factor 2 (NTF2) superfamily protein